MLVLVSLHRGLLPVSWLLKSLVRAAFTSHTERVSILQCLSPASTTCSQRSLLANWCHLWWERFPKAFLGVLCQPPSHDWSLALHTTLRSSNSCPVFIWLEQGLTASDCRRALNISHGGNVVTSMYKYTVMSALRKHQNTVTCLGLMALWKDFYIKKAVAKIIAGFLIPVFLQACSSSVCSELALEVGVTVHEVGYKHHMAAYFSGKILRYRIRGRV